jgi:hypothetical protein
MNEREIRPDVQHHDDEQHPDSQWSIVTWCLRAIGANDETVKDRFEVPWILLVLLGPLHWFNVIALV